jgi:signal transduction histidine kinase
MLFLVNDILDLAQYEEKTLLLHLEPFKINELILQCISILQF